MIDYLETKEHPITREMVLKAFKLVKANKGSSGEDGESIGQYESKLMDNTYKIWNRMSSGENYFPSPILEVEIPEKVRKEELRRLGIPHGNRSCSTASSKNISRTGRLDHIFHFDSYGYRPGKSAHMAIQQAMSRVVSIGWVINMDIKSFFDRIDHDLLLKAVGMYISKEKWVIMYIARWLKADVRKVNGELEKRTQGTPQGGVLSGLLALYISTFHL